MLLWAQANTRRSLLVEKEREGVRGILDRVYIR